MNTNNDAIIVPESYTCQCGMLHYFPAWVYAHWDEKLRHTCESCQTCTELFRGRPIKDDKKNNARR